MKTARSRSRPANAARARERGSSAARAGCLLAVVIGGGAAGNVHGTEPQAVEWELAAGTTAVLVEDHRAPVVHLTIEFPVGSWSPWFRDHDGAEAFEIQLHDSAGRLRQRADRLGTSLVLAAGSRSCTLSARCLAGDLDRVAGLVTALFANRDFDRSELKRRRRQSALGWRAAQKQPFFRGAQSVVRILFSERDPRRLPWEKPERSRAGIAELGSTRDTIVRLPGRTVACAGDVTRETMQRLLAELLPPVADAPPEGLAPDLGAIVPASARPREVTLRIPRLTQVYFAYGRESPSFHSPDYPAFLVADHVLGGHFYSRLSTALRHEGGETYGAGTSNRGDVVPGPYGMGTFTRAPNAERTEAKLRDVLLRLQSGGIDEQERRDAIGYLRGSRRMRRQAPAQILARHLYERRLGLAPGSLDEAVERAAALTLPEINAFVARYYDPEAFTMVRVAPQ